MDHTHKLAHSLSDSSLRSQPLPHTPVRFPALNAWKSQSSTPLKNVLLPAAATAINPRYSPDAHSHSAAGPSSDFDKERALVNTPNTEKRAQRFDALARKRRNHGKADAAQQSEEAKEKEKEKEGAFPAIRPKNVQHRVQAGTRVLSLSPSVSLSASLPVKPSLSASASSPATQSQSQSRIQAEEKSHRASSADAKARVQSQGQSQAQSPKRVGKTKALEHRVQELFSQYYERARVSIQRPAQLHNLRKGLNSAAAHGGGAVQGTFFDY